MSKSSYPARSVICDHSLAWKTWNLASRTSIQNRKLAEQKRKAVKVSPPLRDLINLLKAWSRLDYPSTNDFEQHAMRFFVSVRIANRHTWKLRLQNRYISGSQLLKIQSQFSQLMCLSQL